MATTYTPNFGFGKQENYADTFSMEVITANFDLLDGILNDMSGRVKIKGTVTKYANLPSDASEGDAYKVTYSDDNYADGTVYTYHNGVWVSLAKNSYLKAEINNIDRVELAKIIDGGAKNLLNITKASVKAENTAGIWNGDTYTRNGMNITINDDMTFTVDGEATGMFDFILKQSNLEGLQGYVLSGGNPNSSTVSMLFQMKVNPWTNLANDFGTGVIIQTYDDTKQVAASIHFSAGATADNLIIKPMICTKSAWALSTKYVPYCPTLAEIYAMVQ